MGFSNWVGKPPPKVLAEIRIPGLVLKPQKKNHDREWVENLHSESSHAPLQPVSHSQLRQPIKCFLTWVLPFLGLHLKEIMQYVTVWLFSLRVKLLRFIHVMCISRSSFWMAEMYSIIVMYESFSCSIYSSILHMLRI